MGGVGSSINLKLRGCCHPECETGLRPIGEDMTGEAVAVRQFLALQLTLFLGGMEECV